MIILLGMGGCVLETPGSVLRAPVPREAAWKATQDVIKFYFPVVEADPGVGTIQSDYVGETSPLYRRRLQATISSGDGGKSVIRLRIISEKLSGTYGDYGEAFKRGTWVEVEDDKAQEGSLLREIETRFGVR